MYIPTVLGRHDESFTKTAESHACCTACNPTHKLPSAYKIRQKPTLQLLQSNAPYVKIRTNNTGLFSAQRTATIITNCSTVPE